jgi:hypothetical protein
MDLSNDWLFTCMKSVTIPRSQTQPYTLFGGLAPPAGGSSFCRKLYKSIDWLGSLDNDFEEYFHIFISDPGMSELLISGIKDKIPF